MICCSVNGALKIRLMKKKKNDRKAWVVYCVVYFFKNEHERAVITFPCAL